MLVMGMIFDFTRRALAKTMFGCPTLSLKEGYHEKIYILCWIDAYSYFLYENTHFRKAII